MKFGKSGKEEKTSSIAGLGIPKISQQEALERLREMEKNKVKPEPCPYLKTCNFKMLPAIGRILCLDEENGKGSQSYIAHMTGHHMWEQCRQFIEQLRKEEGVLPRDLKKALKKLKKNK